MANSAQKDLKIIFWNARSISRRKEELSKILTETDIFICVESWLSNYQKNDNFHFPDFKTFRKDRSQSRRGGIFFDTQSSFLQRSGGTQIVKRQRE